MVPRAVLWDGNIISLCCPLLDIILLFGLLPSQSHFVYSPVCFPRNISPINNFSDESLFHTLLLVKPTLDTELDVSGWNPWLPCLCHLGFRSTSKINKISEFQKYHPFSAM